MADHDPLCPMRIFHHPSGPSELVCQCDLIAQVEDRFTEKVKADEEAGRLIAKVRADEREKCRAEVEATAKWCREDERETIAAAIEAMSVSPNADDDYRLGWVRMRNIAARIARDGGRDE